MNTWADLNDELSRWIDAGMTATFWWRDDDAGACTAALERMLLLSHKTAMPLTLAAIPIEISSELGNDDFLATHTRIAQHGYAHQNHAPAHDKKYEFSAARQRETMLDEISRGLKSILALPQSIAVFVPPWNRMDRQLFSGLRELGITGVSMFGPRLKREPVPGLIETNTHADIIDWRGTRGFAGRSAVLSQIIDHLINKRTGAADTDEPTGLLSHHKVHDEACWSFLNQFAENIAEHRAARILDGVGAFRQ